MKIELSESDLKLIDAVDKAVFDIEVSPDDQRAMAMQLAARIISKVTVDRIYNEAKAKAETA